MRKLLNTVYITTPTATLSLEGENMICKVDDETKFRMPFDNIESIVCFNYLGCSPALMGKCAEQLIPISFISPSGKFLARIGAGTRGNVHLRIAQIDRFRESGLLLAANTVAAKLLNSMNVIRRSRHDIPALREDEKITSVLETLKNAVDAVWQADDMETVLGIEGNCAAAYFSIFGRLLSNKDVQFTVRSKRPPLDPVNAVLSFMYTIFTNEYAAALETVGLDSYIGYYHKLRSGRSSLACDLIEEGRCIIDRFVLTLFNLKILGEKDFRTEESGAVLLNDDGRKKVLAQWQEKKRTEMKHPYLDQKIQMGLLPYVQSNLLAKFVRGELEEYPSYIHR